MSCEWACARLTAYHHGELSAAEEDVLERHLAGCPGCAEELESISAVSDWLCALEAEPAPAGLYAAIEAQCAARVAQQSVRQGAWQATLLSPEDHAGRHPAGRRHADARDVGRRYAEIGWRAGMAMLAVAAGVMLWIAFLREPGVRLQIAEQAFAEERVARVLHEQRLSGALPLELESADVAELSELARSHTGIEPRLAAHQPAETAGRIRPVGASYIAEREGLLLALSVDGQPVSLWIGPHSEDTPSEGLIDKEIYFRQEDGLKTLTWARGDKSYVLVSALPGVGQVACFSCHTDAERRARIAAIGQPVL